MRPKQLLVSAWGPYRNRAEVDFEQVARDGIYLITGPTGAGKTAVFDAVSFALYGNVSGQIREKDSLRSDFADADTPTFVELSFYHKKEEYCVHRSPRYSRPKKRGSGETMEPETAWLKGPKGLHVQGTTEVTEQIQRLLGLDYRQFKQLSMIAQGEFMELLTASSRERTQILRDVFGTEQYERFQQLLTARAKALYIQAEEQRHRMEEAVAAVLDPSDRWAELSKGPDYAWGRIQEYLKELQQEEKKEAGMLEEQLGRLEKQYQELVEQVSRARLEQQQLEGFRRQLEQLRQVERQRPQLEQQQEELMLYKKAVPVREYLQEKEVLRRQQQEYLAADGAYQKEKQEFERMDDLHRKAAAGILAAGLLEGQPCPVCGSTAHPHLAELPKQVPAESQLKAMKQRCEKSSREVAALQEKCAGTYGRLQVLAQQLKEQIPELSAEESRRRLLELAKGLQPDVDRMEQQLASAREQALAVEERCRQLTRETAGILARYENTEISAESEDGRTDFQESADRMLERVEEACRQHRDSSQRQQAAQRELEVSRKALQVQKEQLAGRMLVNRRAAVSLRERAGKREELEQSYGVVSDLEKAARGQNPKRLVFEQYVLTGFFEEILEAANLRLQSMTGGRYLLSRARQVSDARTKESMELQVLDAYTGKYRSAKTLSGGESFKAALSLALGMSDVIQSYAGGIEIEALFLDEGFGTLDQESLDQAIGVLTGLAGGKRSIGIISHVNELKERIPRQIVVERTSKGSTVSIRS